VKPRRHILPPAVPAVLVLALWAGVQAADQARSAAVEGDTLRGLSGVFVVLEEVTREVEPLGLAYEVLKADTEQQIRRHGIQLLSEEGLSRVEGTPCLRVAVGCKPGSAGKDPLVSYTILVQFSQDVALTRDPNIVCSAVTWKKTVVGMVQRSGIQKIRGRVEDLVGMFVQDFLAANPTQAAAQGGAEQGRPDGTVESGRAVGEPGPGGTLTLTLGKGVTLDLALISPGSFTMGALPPDQDRFLDEGPLRYVQITKPFYLGKYEVTQDQYKAVMGRNPSNLLAAGQPVEMVSWEDAVAFCTRLSAELTRTIRLPTEAEWEYACRAGTRSRFYWGEDPGQSWIGDHAWYGKNSGGRPRVVGLKKPNGWGLHDMAGNVWEWCSDWYGETYAGLSGIDPQGPLLGKTRVLRGGGFLCVAQDCRSASRSDGSPLGRDDCIGFRIVLDPD